MVPGQNGLVKINLPVHEPAGEEEILDGVHSFCFHRYLCAGRAVYGMNAKGLDNTLHADLPFGDTRIKGISPEIIQPVHIKLTGDKLVKKGPFIGVIKHVDCEREPPIKTLIEATKEHATHVFMTELVDEEVFERM